MARTATKAAPPRTVAPRTPAIIAIERMAKLVSAGASPAKMVTSLEDVLVEWGAEELPPSDMRERVEQLQADIDAGLEAAQDFQADADGAVAVTAAANQVAALRAVQARLAQVIEG